MVLVEQSGSIPIDAASSGDVVVDTVVWFCSICLRCSPCSWSSHWWFNWAKWAFYSPLTPAKLNKISPIAGFKRLFGLKSLVEFLKGLAKLGIVGVIAYIAVRPEFDRRTHRGWMLIDILPEVQWLSRSRFAGRGSDRSLHYRRSRLRL